MSSNFDHWVHANNLCFNYSKRDFLLLNHNKTFIFRLLFITNQYLTKQQKILLQILWI